MPTVAKPSNGAVAPQVPRDARPYRIALLSAVFGAIVFVAIAALFVVHGKPNADEGFYALISHEVMHGKLLYRDLAYTQTPLLPYIQGVAMSVIGFGVAQQRWLNAAIQAATLGLVIFFLVRRRLCLPLVLALGLAWCLCLPLLYYGTIGKTYALAQLFLIIAGISVLGVMRPIPSLILLSLSGVLAVGCRLPVAPAVVILWLGFSRIHSRNISKTLLISMPLLFALLFLGPFIAAAPDSAYFWTWGLHSQVMIPRAPFATLLKFPSFVPGVTIIAILGIVCSFWRYSNEHLAGLCVLLAGVVGAIGNVMASGVYLEYAVPCLGLIILGVGAVFASNPLSITVNYAVAMLCAFVAIPAFLIQDRNWDEGTYLADVRGAGLYIAEHSMPQDQLLTSMPELALAAKRPLYPRSELGKFAITAEMIPQKAFRRQMMPFGELIYLTDHALPKVIAISRYVKWNFLCSFPSARSLSEESYNAFVSALYRNYACSFSNGTFLVYTRKTDSLPRNN